MSVNKRKQRLLSLIGFLFLCLLAAHSRIWPYEGKNPILVLVPKSEANPFGHYIHEILASEGLRNFEVRADVPDLKPSSHPVVVVTESRLEPGQAQRLATYVKSGGALIAFRPDVSLTRLLGVELLPKTLPNAYWKMEEHTHPLPALPFQYKGPARLWKAAGRAETIARLCESPNKASDRPAVLRVRSGKGSALLFAFDPVMTVIYLRQGNPEKANQEIDGLDTIQPHEMAQGGWWDPVLVRVPQADLLQRFLTDSIRQMVPRPLPSIWYFPNRNKSILVMTGDAHRDSPEIIDKFLSDVEGYGGKASVYLLPPVEKKWTRRQVEVWAQRGHEISVHPDHLLSAEHSRERRWQTLEYAVRSFKETYSLPVLTVRNDWLTWYGWVEQARMQRELGILMDLNYVSRIPTFYGYMFGSGLPMRFVDSSGEILDHYQQPTPFEDDIVMSKKGYGSGAFSTDQATELTTGMLRESINGHFNSICLNIHPVHYSGYSGDWARRTMQYAQEKRVPIWSAWQWMEFILARNQTQIEHLQWTESSCSFHITQPKPIPGLTLLVPRRYGHKQLRQVTVDGVSAKFERLEIRGQPFMTLVLAAIAKQKVVVSYAD